MRISYQIVSFMLLVGYVIEIAQGSHNCTSFSDKNHGFGCEIKNVKPEDTLTEITVMSKEANKSDSDIIWVQIRESAFSNIPSAIFEKFVSMERMMIISSTGFKTLNVSYFDKKLSLLLMKLTDLEKIGEKAFSELTQLKVLSLNHNRIMEIHKNAFRDLVNVEKIELVNNSLNYLDPDIFESNVNLKLLLLYNNKIRQIPAALFSRNVNLETIQLQSNNITQVEKGFQLGLTKLTRIDLNSNLCISETITVNRYYQWASYLNKFKDCFNNYQFALSLNGDIRDLNGKINEIEGKVDDMVEKVSADMKIIEGKINNTAEFENIKTNIVDFFKNDKEQIEAKYKDELENMTSHVKTEMIAKIEDRLGPLLVGKQKETQERLVSDEHELLRDEFSSKFATIYIILFAFFCFGMASTYIISRKLNIMPVFFYTKDQRLCDLSNDEV